MSDFAPTADRRSRIAGKPASPEVLMLVLSVMVVAVLAAPAIRTGVFDAMSTDDAMRLVEVRDLIAGQGWFDLVQHRLDPPGASMHWSRVIDAPLAALILILKPLLGIHGAEAVTLFLWPTLWLAAILLLAPAIAGRMCGDGDRQAARLAAVILATLSVPALIHFRAGAIDHHNVQIVAAAGPRPADVAHRTKCRLRRSCRGRRIAVAGDRRRDAAGHCRDMPGGVRTADLAGRGRLATDLHVWRRAGGIVAASRRPAVAAALSCGARLRRLWGAVSAADGGRRRDADDCGRCRSLAFLVARPPRRGRRSRLFRRRSILRAVSRVSGVSICHDRSARDFVLVRPGRRNHVVRFHSATCAAETRRLLWLSDPVRWVSRLRLCSAPTRLRDFNGPWPWSRSSH